MQNKIQLHTFTQQLAAVSRRASRRAEKETCRKMDSCLELVMEVLTKFSDFYTKNGKLQKDKKIISEIEKK